ncbi:MAG TPA: hypothetical protein VFT59_00115 [Candidatus Saccharimonadales bacterium]|nr:hypothetical protein [Candidatus Saccharimonadales bacterium]
MKKQTTSLTRKLTITALVLFALSVILQMIMGRTEYPPVPPAVIITIGAALCLYFARTQKWAGIIAFLVPLSLFVGVTINGWYMKLIEPTTAGYPGIVLQWVTLITALIGTAWLLYSEYLRADK